MNFDFSPVWEGWQALARGTGVTVGITAFVRVAGMAAASGPADRDLARA